MKPLRFLVTALFLLTNIVASAADSTLKATPVTDRVWFVQGAAALGSTANRNFISNAGFVVTDDGVVVIDALGSPALAKELLAEIRRVTPQPVRYVIVTHYHADHIYGQTKLVPADEWISGEEKRLRVGSFDFLIRHVGPAHTPEDLVVFVPKLGVLFSGDLFFRGRIPFVGQADSRLWIASLERLIDYKPRVVVPGHGPVSTDPLTDLQLTRDYLLFLRQTMGEAAHNLEPFDEAYAKANWSRFNQLPLFGAANRMNAYNTYLLMEQQDGK